MKQIIKSSVIAAILFGVVAQTSLLAFTSQSKINQTTFETGRADLSLFKNPALPGDSSNLTHELAGQTYTEVTSSWQKKIGVKVKNTGTLKLNTQLKVQTVGQVSQPDIKNYIKVTIFKWNDDGDGVVQPLELVSITPTQTMTVWLNQPFSLGILNSQAVGSYAIEFETGEVPNTYQGSTASVEFIFDAAAVN